MRTRHALLGAAVTAVLGCSPAPAPRATVPTATNDDPGDKPPVTLPEYAEPTDRDRKAVGSSAQDAPHDPTGWHNPPGTVAPPALNRNTQDRDQQKTRMQQR
jgi:hypothetical protein